MHGDHAKPLPPALALVIVPIDQAMPEGRLLSLGTGLVTLLVIVRHLNGGCVYQQLGQHHPNLQGCRGAGFVHVFRSTHENHKHKYKYKYRTLFVCIYIIII